MNRNVESIILNAKYISAGTSLADNEDVKIHRLETLAKSVSEVASNVNLSSNQKLSFESLLKVIFDLKNLSGQRFRSRATGLDVQVTAFLNELQLDQ
ncbi:hypothetical protein KIH87_08815 [Paraneptunicella aestuarii]|uniref:hypothetical protein n=1 Tax=Paraneptunicella aestuarii TaxID=2831148 RepID=UPI001E539C5C|nr:hypothetical protein [Paraneptunicella aestuarii]UAA40418.1 hypothetical protein KIH87_08815 [Paraneptunicella aestuarii]